MPDYQVDRQGRSRCQREQPVCRFEASEHRSTLLIVLLEPSLKRFDFLFLGLNNLFRHCLDLGINILLFQQNLRHVDGTLMVGDHHAGEIR